MYLSESTDERRKRRKQEWEKEKQLQREHEKLKEEKILEYENKRNKMLKDNKINSQNLNSQNCGKPSRRPEIIKDTATSGRFSDKLGESTRGPVASFKGNEDKQSKPPALKTSFEIIFEKNTNTKEPIIAAEIERIIIDQEYVVIKRRDSKILTSSINIIYKQCTN